MAGFICLHARDEVEAFARGNPLLHAYELGDLDDFFWPHTTWYADAEGGRVRQMVLVYTDGRLPTVLAFAEEPAGRMHELVAALLPVLPRRFHAHLHAGVADVLAGDYRVQSHGDFRKMGLLDRSRLGGVDTAEAVRLSPADRDELEGLYRAAYPGNWFVPRMLETGFYYGVRRGGVLAAVSGVHVFSRRYRVAALGNVATHPEHRGRGLATVATARLCQELLAAGIEHVGLNVRTDNVAAVACYTRLGFVPVAEYGEYTAELVMCR